MFYNYGRDSQCVFFSLQESGQITNTPLSLDAPNIVDIYYSSLCCTCKSKNREGGGGGASPAPMRKKVFLVPPFAILDCFSVTCDCGSAGYFMTAVLHPHLLLTKPPRVAKQLVCLGPALDRVNIYFRHMQIVILFCSFQDVI